MINGQWVEAASGETFATYDPATGEVICEVAAGDKKDIDRAVKAARSAFETGPWRGMTPSDRGRAIWKLADLLEKNLEEFARLESLDNGKPLTVPSARRDVSLLAIDFSSLHGGGLRDDEDPHEQHVSVVRSYRAR